ncbi:BamA/TamA family outer membrane protein [Nemorincola caseinilytica]|uniref:BamA/TamA family outer membrane protein n=1 Tax=Nemorincola caseinilytica TaxID=2054315 RepID=A0ABP8NQ02_9BACT
MAGSVFYKRYICRCVLPLLLAALLAACSSTKHLEKDQYLLWKNKIVLKNETPMPNKGELKENLDNLVVQQPNSNFMGITVVKIPKKLWAYNRRYKRLHTRPDSLLPKSVQRPVIFDSLTMPQSEQNMKNYLFNQGFFYARVHDTVVFRKKKAYTTYTVETGPNYKIDRINYNIDDSAIAAVVRGASDATRLKKGTIFTYSLLEEERSRITTAVNNNGYRRFNLENITFKIDTIDRSIFKIGASPFENAVNYISRTAKRKGTLDIDIIIRKADDSLSYNKYTISKITVYPDYGGAEDRNDTNMITRNIKGVEFKYHSEYVLPRVLYRHMFLAPGNTYSKADEERTISRMGGLGIFHYIRVQFRENRVTRDSLDCSIYLNRAQKYDFSTNFEVSNGTTYDLGNSLSLNFRNKNFLRGANLLTISASGGIELYYDENLADDLYKRFQLLTQYYGINASLDFPKFVAPVASSIFSNSNLPHTVISVGENVIHRINYFQLLNTSATFSYNWRESETKTWTLTPAFINKIRLPEKELTDSFQKVLSSNEYLSNSYKQTFIEGENISFRFDNSARRKGRSYSYLRVAFEEAGGVLKGARKLGYALNQLYTLQDTNFAQYTKYDLDARHYFAIRKSVMALRFNGGVGIPYGPPWTLPYIKQYFAGGPYSLRGWRIRSLGPGSYRKSLTEKVNQIDLTGDIKLEANAEYRFPVMPLFAGAVKMNGALFADAGNIWLANPDTAYAGGELAMDKLGQDIAMDLGIGSRFEIASFLTVRVDMAIPVKKPYVHTNSGWVFKDIAPFDNGWRAENVVFSFSIGYPF